MMNFPLNLAVGFAQPVNQVGNYVYYKAGSAGGADPSIKVKTDLGDEYILMPGQGFRLDNRTFTNLQITNAGAVATIIGSLLIADGGFFDNRVTGSVEVIDGGKNRTLAQVAFIGQYSLAPGAGLRAVVTLWNPAASGKNLIVNQVSCNCAAADSMSVASTQTQQTIIANGTAKKLGAPGAAGQIQGAAVAAATTIATLGSLQNGQIYRFTEPVIVPPGWGIVVSSSILQSPAGASFEWYEEAA